MRTLRTARLAMVLAFVMVAAVDGRDRLELRARPGFAFAPSDVEMEFSILPNEENRALPAGDYTLRGVPEILW